MQEKNIRTLSFGCRLNALECEKIAAMLAPHIKRAIVVNTCSVTAEAERQCAQAIRRAIRENPDTPVFITGCGATRNPELFGRLGTVVANKDKLQPAAYGLTIPAMQMRGRAVPVGENYSKAFVQIQNGCDWNCAYCITRILRGPAVSFPYDVILADVIAAVTGGFPEIVLTGIDIASYKETGDRRQETGDRRQETGIFGLCERLLQDVPEIQRLRLSSMDPASLEIPKIIDLMKRDARMMPHLHLSMQSGSDAILGAMRRRHNADMVKKIAGSISVSWDIICGFPGETDELFAQTAALARELKPIKIHAFPFSPRPGTPAADMPNQIPRNVSKARVKTMLEIANANLREFMAGRIGTIASVLVENGNMARTPDDIAVKITGAPLPARQVRNIEIIDVEKDMFIGKLTVWKK